MSEQNLEPPSPGPTPVVSIIMSVYNNAPYLSAAIESMTSQSFTDFEFLIVDDGSTDDSDQILTRAAAADQRIRLFRQQNRGLVPSLNRMIDEARAPLLARMDGDDVADRDRLMRQIDFLGRHPEVGVLGTNARDIDASGRSLGDPGPIATQHEQLIDELRTRSPFCHPSVIMRAEIARAAGGYRPAFKHCEDFDLWLRLSGTTRFANLPDTLLSYRRSLDQVSSRYTPAQHYGSIVARLCHKRRLAGDTDPLENVAELPAVDALDRLFGSGTTRKVRDQVALGIVHSRAALKGEGLDLILDYVRDSGTAPGLWRTVGRLVKMGEMRRAMTLAWALSSTRWAYGRSADS